MLGSLWVPRGKKTPFNNRLIRMERTSWFERLLQCRGRVPRQITQHRLQQCRADLQQGAEACLSGWGVCRLLRWVSPISPGQFTDHPGANSTIARRVGRYPERQGLLEQDAENSYLTTDAVSEYPMNQLPGHSITYRIAVGPQAGRKVFTLQTLPGCGADEFADTVGKVCGFSLHAGVAARADERKKLERLCRYISRPAVAEKRLSLTSVGNIRYQLKTPYRDGTTHVIFEPLDFMARLAALAPKPRANLTRFHGVDDRPNGATHDRHNGATF